MNNGKICVSVCAETADQMIAKIKRAEPLADIIEVRFDCLNPADLQKVLETVAEVNPTCLITFRPREQGGRREISLSERLQFWESIFALPSTNFIIDIEADPNITTALAVSKVPCVISYHSFGDGSADTEAIFEKMMDFEAEAYKIASTVEDAADAISVWRSIDKAAAVGGRAVPIAMGEAGKWTRILGLAHGAYMTYASLDDGEETADGQITAKDLIEVYRVKDLDKNTAVYGVVGDPVSSSLSPCLHNAGFSATGLNAVFLPLQVTDLDEFVRRMVAPATRDVELNFLGFSVTMPHKQTIMRHLDGIDVVAEKIGAVNTVRIVDDKLIGYNTDAHGFITPLKREFGDLKNARVAVIGAGGAARACAYALADLGAEVTVFARDAQKASSLADEFNIHAAQLTADNRQLAADIIVNATPLGMVGPLEDRSPLTSAQLKGVKFVYDLVTRSGDTPLVAEAKKAGAATIDGVEMLVSQGLRQFEIWTGRDAPEAVMRQAVMSRLNR